MNCLVPENVHTLPTAWPLWKFQLSFMHFFKFFGFKNCTLWIFLCSIYLSWDYIFQCCCSLGITSSCTDEQQRLLKSNKKKKNSRDILLVYTETSIITEGFRAKNASITVWADFHSLQSQANFWQTDLFWHGKHHSVIIIILVLLICTSFLRNNTCKKNQFSEQYLKKWIFWRWMFNDANVNDFF